MQNTIVEILMNTAHLASATEDKCDCVNELPER